MQPESGLIPWLCYALLTLLGWRMVGTCPDFPKYVLVGAPHTSNWDFVYGMLFNYASGLRFRWIGKASLFKPPLGAIFRRFGGIPVWRDKKSNYVDQIASLFNQSKELVVAITPEGTRKRTPYWKTGFYYIALGARVPIVLAFLDYGRKRIGLGPVLHPTGDIQADFQVIREFYADKTGAHPLNQEAAALLPGNDADLPAPPASFPG